MNAVARCELPIFDSYSERTMISAKTLSGAAQRKSRRRFFKTAAARQVETNPKSEIGMNEMETPLRIRGKTQKQPIGVKP
ncbi:MAG TPA: hypothetical protein PLF81_01405 [Candidatus Anammoximicrobium sp.]|nr:hypothetical protein [Candidatus Anammoximicrobium sp.]